MFGYSQKTPVVFFSSLLLSLTGLLNPCLAATGADSPTVTLIPAWVKPVEVETPTNVPADKVSQGVYTC